MIPGQRELFGHDAPSIDRSFSGAVRRELADAAWLEHVPGWVSGHAQLFESLLHEQRWQQYQREMYGRTVDEPRLHASLDVDALPPVVADMRAAIEQRWGEPITRVTVALYRDGRDSVAWHGDTIARELPTALVATVSVGGPRTFMMRPKSGGASISLRLGGGDLVVMGGTAQRT
ncbi:MAG: alpha-ketoglutarate-dependent dioxygenase AlkB, partial [Deltaproteobacteria bacterium]|nr:alpha-ketoglutarate-dependent dioxygenase AlkB [Nannocystaceae bacterium]